MIAPSTSAANSRRKLLLAAGIVAVWLTIVSVGMTILTTYAHAPGRERPAPSQWPASAALKLSSKPFTLVMMIHPHCPCSRASVDELSRIMRYAEHRVFAHVLVVRPPTMKGSCHTDLWTSAAAIPDVRVHEDVDGVDCRRFGGETSGAVVLYDAAGRLLFSGGITSARGHAGDNLGSDSIVALINGQTPALRRAAVFGCALFETEAAPGSCPACEVKPCKH